MSSSITAEMDLLQVPSKKVYKIQPMDASHFAPHPDHYDDDEEVGLGYQRTLVNTSRYGLSILLIFFHCICAALSQWFRPLVWICTPVSWIRSGSKECEPYLLRSQIFSRNAWKNAYNWPWENTTNMWVYSAIWGTFNENQINVERSIYL